MNIQPIYFRRAEDLASTASYLHEVSEGRFRLGLGVSHGPVHDRLHLTNVRPLSDVRAYVAELRAAADGVGGLPPIALAALRHRMVDLAVEVTEGVVWANAAFSYMPTHLARIPAERVQDGFVLGNVLPVVIDDDRSAGAAASRDALHSYLRLSSYRSYWTEAGYGDEISIVEAALARGDVTNPADLMSDRWLADVAIWGNAKDVRAGVEAWQAAGVTTPILVPASTSGSKLRAFEELFSAYS